MNLRTYWLPGLLALLQASGLVLALVADGPWEWLAWVLVAAPCVVFAASVSRQMRQATD
ncbi:protein of unknown function [Hyphomicrobium sp. 1Nfss2.1]|uniref:hypothetical protein n=1 Tax=Hyphomicrobium sp. 1Nfss2.1 TaxID=3413936 RepID=UPI003C7B14AC